MDWDGLVQTNRKILFHSSHGILEISFRNFWSNGKRPPHEPRIHDLGLLVPGLSENTNTVYLVSLYPLTWLFNQSQSNRSFPTSWKAVPVSSLFLVSRTLRLTIEEFPYFQFCLRSWINVSFVYFIIAVTQSLILSNIAFHQEIRSLLPIQYILCNSVNTAHVHLLTSSLDFGGQINNIYFNMAKAFDRVPHKKGLEATCKGGLSVIQITALGISNALLFEIALQILEV